MNRNELLEHLPAVCDAENAAYACQEAIEALDTLQSEMENGMMGNGMTIIPVHNSSDYQKPEHFKVSFIYPIPEPIEPIEPEPIKMEPYLPPTYPGYAYVEKKQSEFDETPVGYYAKKVLIGICGFLGFFAMGLLSDSVKKVNAALGISLPFIGFFIGITMPYIIKGIRGKTEEYDVKKRNDDIRESYEEKKRNYDMSYEEKKRNYERRCAEKKREYEEKKREYEDKKRRYNADKEKWLEGQRKLDQQLQQQKEAMEAQYRLKIQDLINENETTLVGIKARLKELYDMGIIYPRFQNMVAVNTMREYVEMGLCDTLEGSNGAYSVYLQDLRANRICDSIGDLKDAMEDALSRIANNQAILVQEVNKVEDAIISLQASVTRNLSELNVNLGRFQSDIIKNQSMQAERISMMEDQAQTMRTQMQDMEAQRIRMEAQRTRMIEEQTQKLTAQLQSMDSTIKNAAYNDYIQKRMEETNVYLRTHYKHPNEK